MLFLFNVQLRNKYDDDDDDELELDGLGLHTSNGTSVLRKCARPICRPRSFV